MPVWMFFAVTIACATTEPDGSTTEPEMEPAVEPCPTPIDAVASKKTATASKLKILNLIRRAPPLGDELRLEIPTVGEPVRSELFQSAKADRTRRINSPSYS